MSIKIKKKELNENLDEIKNEEEQLINYRKLIQEKKNELDEIKSIWKNKIEKIKNLKISVRTTKEYLKANKKNRNVDSLNGFTKPVRVEEKLEKFLNLENGNYVTRTFIWNKLYAYIKEHNLLSENDKRNIVLDNKYGKNLQELLDLNYECSNIYSIRKNIENLIIKE